MTVDQESNLFIKVNLVFPRIQVASDSIADIPYYQALEYLVNSAGREMDVYQKKHYRMMEGRKFCKL